jgi:beta-mannosidase
VLLSGSKKVQLRYGESVKQQTLDLAKLMEKHHRDNLYLRIALDIEGVRVSEDTVFLTLPRFVKLPKTAVKTSIRSVGEKEVEVTFKSPGFQHRFCFDLSGAAHQSSDNYFELYPNEAKTVRVTLARPATRAAIERKLTWMSLAGTFE